MRYEKERFSSRRNPRGVIEHDKMRGYVDHNQYNRVGELDQSDSAENSGPCCYRINYINIRLTTNFSIVSTNGIRVTRLKIKFLNSQWHRGFTTFCLELPFE